MDMTQTLYPLIAAYYLLFVGVMGGVFVLRSITLGMRFKQPWPL